MIEGGRQFLFPQEESFPLPMLMLLYCLHSPFPLPPFSPLQKFKNKITIQLADPR